VEALLLLAHPRGRRGAGLNDKNAASSRHEIAGVLARGMMRMAGTHHVTATFLDGVECQLLPADRALDFVADRERKQGVMSDENAESVARRAREGLADKGDLVLVDPPVLEGQRACGVDAEHGHARQ